MAPVTAEEGSSASISSMLKDKAKQYALWIDERVPKIRGRPAMEELRANIKPGVTVALVSLPLSISLAIASDATPVQGVITAAWAGLVSSLTGGSHYNIVGPTGALSGILSEFSITYGPLIQPLLAVLAGVIALLVWSLRLQRYFVFIPSSVMHGFTLGVAFIIAFNQLNFAFGLPKLPRHTSFIANLTESFANLDKTRGPSLLFFIVVFGLLYNLSKRYGKVPWAIILALIGILIGSTQDGSDDSWTLTTIKTRYGELDMQLVGSSVMFSEEGPGLSGSEWLHIFAGAISIAVVAVLETLISASIADRMTKTLFAPRQEVLSVALANLASGLTGGLPATAALARTSLNIKSGASSRAAGIVNAISIFILSTILFGAFQYLPLPIVAAILVNVAYRMVEWHEIKLLLRLDPSSFVVVLLTAVVCIVEDPTMGIIIGALFAMIRMLSGLRSAHTQVRLFRGTSCKASYLFRSVDIDKSVINAGRVIKARLTEKNDKTTLTLLDMPPLPPGSDAAIAAANSVPGMPEDLQGGEDTDDEGTALTGAAAPAADQAGKEGADRELSDAEAGLNASLPLVAVYTLPSYITFVSAQGHRDRLRGLFLDQYGPLRNMVHIAFGLQKTHYADPDALEALGTLIEELTRAGKRVYLLGFHSPVRKTISRTHFYHQFHMDGLSFPDLGFLTLHLAEVSRGTKKDVYQLKADHEEALRAAKAAEAALAAAKQCQAAAAPASMGTLEAWTEAQVTVTADAVPIVSATASGTESAFRPVAAAAGTGLSVVAHPMAAAATQTDPWAVPGVVQPPTMLAEAQKQAHI